MNKRENSFDNAIDNAIDSITEFIKNESWYKKDLPQGINLSNSEIIDIKIEANNLIYDMVLDYAKNKSKEQYNEPTKTLNFYIYSNDKENEKE